MHKIPNKISNDSFTKNTENEPDEQNDVESYGEFIDKVHVRMKFKIQNI